MYYLCLLNNWSKLDCAPFPTVFFILLGSIFVNLFCSHNYFSILITCYYKAYDCWTKGKRVDEDKYLVPCFSGLVISLSGFHSAEKREYKELIQSHGGTYSSNLDDTVTHLVINVRLID